MTTPSPLNARPLSGNPYLDEIDNALAQGHANLSPPAQEAVSRSGVAPALLGLVPPTAQPTPAVAPLAAPRPAMRGLASTAPPELSGAAGPASAAPLMPMAMDRPLPPPQPLLSARPLSQLSPTETEYNRLHHVMTPAELAQGGPHTHLNTGASGLEQIHSPWARVPLEILNAIGTGFAPRLTSAIPGTPLHHQAVVAENEDALKTEQGVANEEQRRGLEGAQTAHLGAETEKLGQPPPDEYAPLNTSTGIRSFNKRSGATKPVTDEGGTELQPFEKTPADKPAYHVLPDGTVIALHTDESGKSNAEVVYKGDPKVPTEVKQLEIGGKPHQVLINSQTGATVKDLGETGEKPPVTNINAETSALDRESSRFAKAHEKSISDANSQLEKITDARAMVNGNAESQALGLPKVLTALVSGQGSGVRITQAELNMIGKARGIEGDVEGFINKLSGKGQLTGTQKQQLTQILDDVKARVLQKQQIANDALDSINSAKSREEIVAADKAARDKLGAMEKGQGGATGPQQGGDRPGTHVGEMRSNGKITQRWDGKTWQTQ
jgi:hypothetical protein